MKILILPVAAVSTLALLAACGETSEQRMGTGAAGGAVTGAVVGGPVGAVVGAGVGAVAGANREEIDDTTDKATHAAKEKISEATDGKSDQQPMAPSASRTGALTNADVRAAQTALSNMGLYDGRIDGIYGSRTIQAVSEFQARNNLPRTGALTQRTRELLQQQASRSTATNR